MREYAERRVQQGAISATTPQLCEQATSEIMPREEGAWSTRQSIW